MVEQFVAGLVGAPFGLKGHVKVRPFSGDVESLLRLKTVLVRQGVTERTLQIEESVRQGIAVLFKFAGFDSPEAAKNLRGAELLVDREHASPLGPGEFYVEDLRDLAVTGENGEILGRITDIVAGGGGDLVEMRLPAGELKLVPFRKEFFSEISPEKGRLVLINRWILD